MYVFQFEVQFEEYLEKKYILIEFYVYHLVFW